MTRDDRSDIEAAERTVGKPAVPGRIRAVHKPTSDNGRWNIQQEWTGPRGVVWIEIPLINMDGK